MIRKNLMFGGSSMRLFLKSDQRVIVSSFFTLAILLGVLAFIWNTPLEIWRGSLIIFTAPGNLITDYFEIANVGAAFMNGALMLFQAIFILKISKTPVNSMIVAAVFTIVGFSFFGKNLYNSTSIIFGVYLYYKVSKIPFNWVPIALFGTALGPLVSVVSFGFSLPTITGLLLGNFVGIIAGFFMPILSQHFIQFHQGFSLYNIGFTAGMIGSFFMAIFQSFALKVTPVYLVSEGNNRAMSLFLIILFSLIFLLSWWLNDCSFVGFSRLLKESGRGGSDYFADFEQGIVLMNMSLLGLISTGYVLCIGGELNGPTIGGIFTVFGFGAVGKHIKNVIPILAGVFIVGYFSAHDVNSTAAILAALFGTTLAPISGYYGPMIGILAGGIFIMFTTNSLAQLHAGMNLYNNGFAGGFVAAVMAPILDKLVSRPKEKNLK